MADEALLIEAKRALREESRRNLRSIDPLSRRAANRAACDLLVELDEIVCAQTILFYDALPEELDPGSAFARCLENGLRVALPRIDEASRELEAIEVTSLDERLLVRDRLGVRVPREGRTLRATELDVVIVPGLAFDRAGGRLGRGAGFYDRLLVRLPERCPSVGFAFERQIVADVPRAAHDRRVAVLVTEREARFTSELLS